MTTNNSELEKEIDEILVMFENNPKQHYIVWLEAKRKLKHLVHTETQRAVIEGRISERLDIHESWMRDKGYDPKNEPCRYCFGEGQSLEHDAIMAPITDLQERLATINQSKEKK